MLPGKGSLPNDKARCCDRQHRHRLTRNRLHSRLLIKGSRHRSEGVTMSETCLEKPGIRHRRAARRSGLVIASVIGAALAGITAAQAQKLTVWSGYPEMEP